MTLLKRCTLIVDDSRVTHVFYSVLLPDRNVSGVAAGRLPRPGGALRKRL